MKNEVSTQEPEGDPEDRDICGEWNAKQAEQKTWWRAQVAQRREKIASQREAGQPPRFDLKYLYLSDEEQPASLDNGADGHDTTPTSPDLGVHNSIPDQRSKGLTSDLELDALIAKWDEPTTVSDSVAASAPSSHPVSSMLAAEGLEGASAEKPESHDPDPATPTPTPSDSFVSSDPVVASAAAPSGLERFPVTSLDDVPAFDDPRRELAEIFRELQAHKDYPAVRSRCCQLSIRLNLEGELAPAFRHWPRGVAPWGASINMLMTRDQLVIDYHWFHAKRMELSPLDDDHAHLLDLGIDFDFAAAWVLTGRKQAMKYRAAEALCLTPLQQCQTMKLHSVELRERMVRIHGGYRMSGATSHSDVAKVNRAIGQWIERDPRIKSHRISYERLWLARELLGPGVSKQSIAELHALMLSARPLDRKTIAGKLDLLKRHVDIALETPSAR